MNVLIIAPHRDDEILGVGGTILKRKASGDRVSVCVVTAKSAKAYEKYTAIVDEERSLAHQFCKVDQYIGLPFEPVILENYPRAEINKALLDVIVSEKPDEVYLPFWGDMQKDHRLTVDAAMVVLRSKYNHPVKRIYAYETLSETGINIPNASNAFIPNVFEDITDYIDGKVKALSFYESQLKAFPDLRSKEAVEALAKYRGATVNIKAAEAFMLVRETR